MTFKDARTRGESVQRMRTEPSLLCDLNKPERELEIVPMRRSTDDSSGSLDEQAPARSRQAEPKLTNPGHVDERGGFVVWVAEQTEVEAEHTAAVLKRCCVVRVFATGRGLVAAFAQSTPDLIVLGSQLPDMSPMDVCGHVRGRRGEGQPPIVINMSAEQSAQAVAALSAGANDCVAKSSSGWALLARVQAVKNGRALPMAWSAMRRSESTVTSSAVDGTVVSLR